MSLGSLRRPARRTVSVAVLAALAVAFAIVLPLLGAEPARAGGLSGQDYTTFVITSGGGNLVAYDAQNPGVAETTIGAPPGSFFHSVAIDPSAQQVLVTVTAATGNPAEVIAYSTQDGGELGAVPVPLVNPGPIAISAAGVAAVGDLGSPTFVSLALHPGVAPSVVGTTSLPPEILSGEEVSPAAVCVLAYSPDATQLYVGADSTAQPLLNRFHRGSRSPRIVTAAAFIPPCGSQRAVVTELFAYGSSGIEGMPLVSVGQAPLATSGAIAALQVAPAPDGTSVYAAIHANSKPGEVVKVTGLGGSAPSGSVIFVDKWDVAGLAMSPNGGMLYLAENPTEGPAAAQVATIDTSGALQGPPVSISDTHLTDVGVTPDGRQLLVTSQAGLSAIALPFSVTSAAPQVLATGSDALAITPDQAPVASLLFSPTAPNPGTAVTFNATGSSVAYGQITTYSWDFGDGSTTSGSQPTVTHAYSATGNYQVTLTETDGAGTSIPPAIASFPVDYTGQTASKRADPSARTAVTVTVTNPPPTSPTTPPPTTPTTPPPTTTHPTTSTTHPTTSTTHPTTGTTMPTTSTTHPGTKSTTTLPHSSVTHPTGTTIPTTTTTTLPPPGSPILKVTPTLGPPGQVAAFNGKNFPAFTPITVQWSTGIGSVVVTSSATGTISGSILVMYRDGIGPRQLDAVGYPTAVAGYLVVPGPEEPAGSSNPFLFRR